MAYGFHDHSYDKTLNINKKTFMYFKVHEGSDKGNRKTKKLIMSF